jgi:uncharacterized protein DUF4157
VQSQSRFEFAPAASPVAVLQRKCACGQHQTGGGECSACDKERDKALQRAAMSHSVVNSVPPIVHEVLRSPGQPLDAATRGFMEPRFGHDFSRVRVHTDEHAAASARAVSALAYTVSQNIVFGRGQHRPQTREGQKLLAHELSHVVQQSGGIGKSASLPPSSIGQLGDRFEQEADHAAGVVMTGENSSPPQLGIVPSAPQVIRRQPAEAERTPEQVREMQLRQLAIRPQLALKQWRQLSLANRDQVLRNMVLLYGPSFSSEFLKYAKGEKKPKLNEGGVLKGFEFTPKWFFDRGYRRAYGELWVHPSGEEITFLGPRTESPEPPVDMAKKCPESCLSDTQDQEECSQCCETTFPDAGSECRKYCDTRCNDKM